MSSIVSTRRALTTGTRQPRSTWLKTFLATTLILALAAHDPIGSEASVAATPPSPSRDALPIASIPGATADWWDQVQANLEGQDQATGGDPMSSPAWTAESNQVEGYFGYSVAGAGDVNGDGFSDVIVGSPLFTNGQQNEGRAFVFHGSSGGLSSSPSWTAESNQALASFGTSAATAGDVNGDGYSDVIVGAPYFSNGEGNEGRVFVFLGSSTGVAASPAWTAEGGQAGAHFGISVGTAGDVNGDGVSDVIIGAHNYFNGETDEGRAFVYHGSPSGLAASPAWIAESNQANSRFGISVGTAGDVNGDRYADVIVGADKYTNGHDDEGRAFVYHGSPSGLAGAPAWTAESNQIDARFGNSVAAAGDVNGDGFADVIIGAWLYDNGFSTEGKAFVYHGAATGLSTTAAWTTYGYQSDARFGYSVAPAGDVNGDGYADVIVGAWGHYHGQPFEGRAVLYQGSPNGLTTFPISAYGVQEGARFGWAVMAAGDVNGDGLSDVIVGAPLYDNPERDEGRAFVYHGAAAGLAPNSAWTVSGNQINALMGGSVATAGDVNGDGFSDVIVGVPNYNNGEVSEGRAYVYLGSASGPSTSPVWTAESNLPQGGLGICVASAGDVNGDGFSDIIVAASQSEDGEVFVYHGSQTGLPASPNWTAVTNQSGTEFGFSVAGAGDVNGDGFSDIIVGAPGYDNGEGRAFVYHGGPSGLRAFPSWTAAGNQPSSFGVSVATAGDVNGDGFSDVVVGAYGYSNGQTGEGRIFVYHGWFSGLGASPASTAESNQVGAGLGWSVAPAGDVDGDGFSDVIAGAITYTNGEASEGRAFVYHGSLAGMAAVASWTAESNQSSAWFGRSVASAGDVNGDGFSDVIVGSYGYDNFQTDEGRAYLFEGSAAGLSGSPAWTAEPHQAEAFFGVSVATAGDVNGDGFSDILVGAPRLTQGGLALLYFGNEGDGLHLIARQARTDDSAPIALLGRSNAETAFRLKALGRTPAGRGRVSIQYEVKPAGVPFDGAGLVTGSWNNTGAPTGAGSTVALSTVADGLDSATLYHWRLRIRTDSPYAPRSHWLCLPYNAVTEGDVRTHAVIGIADPTAAPPAPLWLQPSVPNPFESTTQITYTLPQVGRPRLAVFDIQGRMVAQLVDEMQRAGRYTAQWDGRDQRGHRLPSGVYLIRLEFAGRAAVSRKVVLAR